MEETPSLDGNGGGMTLEQAVDALNNLRERQKENSDDDTPETSQPLAQAFWETQVPPNFKMPHLPTFDGKS
ncbi:hypothetical protein A2U01_0086541, partial [Trifolium medium]|nr:hypothetical protein [Trifolium medium]